MSFGGIDMHNRNMLEKVDKDFGQFWLVSQYRNPMSNFETFDIEALVLDRDDGDVVWGATSGRLDPVAGFSNYESAKQYFDGLAQ